MDDRDPQIRLSDDQRRRLAAARRAVVFTGAGISKESGLDTFRGDPDSVWQRVRPEEMATPQAFEADPERVWSWYGERHAAVAAAEPNPAHRALVRLAASFPSFQLVTQNVDGLHQQAGSRDVVELHGTLRDARCHRCGRRRGMAESLVESPQAPPRCACGGPLRPAVVWFGELLPEGAMERATGEAARADLFVAVGTSGTVFPAAGLIEIAHRGGGLLVEVNPEETAFSGLVALRLAAPASVAVPALVEEVVRCRPMAT